MYECLLTVYVASYYHVFEEAVLDAPKGLLLLLHPTKTGSNCLLLCAMFLSLIVRSIEICSWRH